MANVAALRAELLAQDAEAADAIRAHEEATAQQADADAVELSPRSQSRMGRKAEKRAKEREARERSPEASDGAGAIDVSEEIAGEDDIMQLHAQLAAARVTPGAFLDDESEEEEEDEVCK